MEIKAILQKPYDEEQRVEFIVEYNHNQGYIIEETDQELQALWYTEEELAQKEAERIAKLYLTGADVERGIYQAKGMDFEDIIAFVSANPPQGLDIKALKIELKANHFYRGNPYVDAIGGLLGFTSEQLDNFFEFNDWTYLISEPDVDNSEVTTEETSVVDDVTELEDVNNSDGDVNNTEVGETA